jgi:hypothetical protein
MHKHTPHEPTEKYVREETPTPEKFADYLITKLEPTTDEDVFPYRCVGERDMRYVSRERERERRREKRWGGARGICIERVCALSIANLLMSVLWIISLLI